MLRHIKSFLSHRKLCLIADDSRMIRTAARTILHDLQFRTAEAENGREALSRCLQQTPDAILLDQNMPYMDGMSFLRALQEGGLAQRSKIIFCSNDRNPAQIASAMHAGAHEYLIKPFDRSILTAKMEKLGLTI